MIYTNMYITYKNLIIILHHLSNGNGMDNDEHNDSGGNDGGSEGMEGEIHPDRRNLADYRTSLVAHGSSKLVRIATSSLFLFKVRFMRLTHHN